MTSPQHVDAPPSIEPRFHYPCGCWSTQNMLYTNLKVLLMITVFLPSISTDDLRSKTRFKDALLTGILDWEKGVAYDVSSTALVGLLMATVARSRLECARTCVLNSNCQAVNFHKKDTICSLLSDFQQPGIKKSEGWDFLNIVKVNIRKGKILPD